jgi:hypothetical protein
MSRGFRTSAEPFSGVNAQTLHVTEDAYINTLNVDNIVFENGLGDNLEILETITFNTITNGQITMSDTTITGLSLPTVNSDAANKEYVDSLINNISWKEPVKVATTENITLSGAQTIDDIAVTTGDRILVKNQTNPVENGYYNVVDPGAWTRATDMEVGDTVAGYAVVVQEGTINEDTAWIVTNDTLDDVVGTNGLVFSIISGSQGTWKEPVTIATVGANIALTGIQTIDGILLVADDRVLVKDQTTPTENGIYNVNVGAWTRTADATTALSATKTAMFVEKGTVNADKLFFCETNDAIFGDATSFVDFAIYLVIRIRGKNL